MRDESVDAALVRGAIVTRDEPQDDLEQLLQGAGRQVRAGEALRSEGVSPAQARDALNPPPLRTTLLEGEDDSGDQGLAFVASLLLYMQLIIYGLAVASGVVEEKASRVVEVLLASISPRALLAGKIAGIGVLGLMQLTLTAVVGIALAAASGAIELDGGQIGTIAVVLVWFLLGYVLWASLYAIGGAIVSRQEDLQSSTTVLTLALVGQLPAGVPGRRRSRVEHRGDQLAGAVLVSDHHARARGGRRRERGRDRGVARAALVGIALLVPVGARIYENSVLRMGKQLKLREAWRSSSVAR